MKKEKNFFEFVDEDGLKKEYVSWHKETNGDVPYPKIIRKPSFMLPVAVPYGNETFKDAQNKLLKKVKIIECI